MNGLEAVEVPLSEIMSENDVLRIDSNYYNKEFLAILAQIEKKTHQQLSSLTRDIKSFGAYALCNQVTYIEKGIPFLRCVNIKNNKINFDDILYIDEDANKLLEKSEVKPNTVLLTMSGTIGNVAIAMDTWQYPMNSNQDIAKIEANHDINPYYLYAFLSSKFGQLQLQKMQVGSVQQHVFLWQIATMKIVCLNDSFQKCIEIMVKESFRMEQDSLDLYVQANNLLLTELGLIDYTPKCEQVSIKSFSESFGESGRLDSEYYSPKYDELFTLLEANAIYCRRVKEIASFNGRGISPKYQENGELRIINSQHILERGLEYEGFDRTNGINWAAQAKARVFKYDVLTYSTGANVGRTAVYLEEDKALAGIDVNILRVEKENPVYVGFVMNSLIGRMQTRRLITGSAQAHLYATDIDQFVIPFIDPNVQEEIIRCVLQAHRLERKSKDLLESIRRVVEIAVEQNEEVSMKWIKDNGV